MVDIVMPSPCTAPSQAVLVKAFRWRTRSDHGTRKALATRNNEAYGQGNGRQSFRTVLRYHPPSPGKFGRIKSGPRPLLFWNSGVGSFTSHKNQISESAVRQDLRFFVLIRED